MPKHIQNLVILMEPCKNPWDVSLMGGNMCLNLFSIDEDAAFESSGVHYLKKLSKDIYDDTRVMESKRKSKGKKYSSGK